MDPKAFLLQKFNVTARQRIDEALHEGIDALKLLLSKGLEVSAKRFNKEHLRVQTLPVCKDHTPLDYILSEDATIIPSKGILRACAIYVLDLWKSRSCLSKIEGFDHSGVNTTLGACGHLPELEEGPCLPFSLWQCGEFDVLSETFDVMEFDFTKQICQCEGKSSLYT
ncbi:Protein arginine N-methyltransferase 7 [Trifolium repens]|nr:Protein arginine N-methyltransferase 7 [Trifolium repens]